ncbi:predicted protein [Thalassiosira pseudonana CCMP1335]|uniref:Uncharacterized protein n=1 Tax=Thalassiosira pseudonana TaxID=35128 RepID=B8CBT1_THAPS|nr:predicted protein [Thalassiosira pseudonana CCMP1335]EED89371.1 predicted protein [Thalassiosira pseudonana CCMP1335]
MNTELEHWTITNCSEVWDGNASDLGDDPVWKIAELLPMLDPPRNDTPNTIESLHHANTSVQMITGDHADVGKETARLIGLGTFERRAGSMLWSTSSREVSSLDMVSRVVSNNTWTQLDVFPKHKNWKSCFPLVKESQSKIQ